ncbi:MAG: biotin/lipoyl-containing protein, partial [Acidimicrobiia bacterium]
MSTREIRLPALSPTMEEVVLLAWKVAPGDTITDGQPIAEVSTAWVDMDLEAPFPGTIVELLVGAGDTVALGQTIATLVTDDTFAAIGLSAAKSEASPPGQGAEPTTDPRGGVGIVGASPPARKMARELGIDLSVVEATGVRGQVTPLDVKRYHELSSVPQMEAPLEAAPADTAVAAPPQQASPVPDTTDTAPPPPAPIPHTTSPAPPP